MDRQSVPEFFRILQVEGYIKESDILTTQDGFFFLYKSLSDMLLSKGIVDFPDSDGRRLLCSNFYDDWFLYAVPDNADYTYSLLKLREQEHDTECDSPADGDTPGVTISFISFACEILHGCLNNPVDENRTKLDSEINRVVSRRGQNHHIALKKYFINPASKGSYLVASIYTKHIASYATDGYLYVPEQYKNILKQHAAHRDSVKLSRLPCFIESLNREAGYVVCDNSKIYIQNPEAPTAYESAAILATHAGNTSVYSFAAEVEYHARFLTPAVKIKIPFYGRSIYDSAIRADMTVGDTEFEGTTPFYRSESNIVKRQYSLHHK